MKRTTLILLTITVCLASFSQGKSGADIEPKHTVSFSHNRISINDAEQIVNHIVNTMGIEENFILKEGRVKNIEASIKRKKQQIIYNPDFINNLQYASNSRWAIIALFAHEIGHHVKGHTHKKSGSRPHLELEADEFAGYVLQKMGAPLEESAIVMQYIATFKGSKTHPGRNDRTTAIRNGWMRGNNEVVKASNDFKTIKENSRASGATN
jgi:hypothetical protein